MTIKLKLVKLSFEIQSKLDRQGKERNEVRMKLRAFVISAVGTGLPCLLAGMTVGVFFRSSFWYWMLGISALALFYVCLDRIPVRLFAGTMRGLSLWPLLKYGFASTDKRSSNYNRDEDWRYWFLYNSDHHKH